MNHTTHIRARRISDFWDPISKVAPARQDATDREAQVQARIEAEAHHECEYGEPGVCPSCARRRKPKRGSKRWLRIEKIKRRLVAKLNGAGEEKDDAD